jgi:hypothetical protein
MSQWHKYYPILSQAHKNKYDVLDEELKSIKKNLDKNKDRMNYIREKVWDSDEYKNIIHKMPSDTNVERGLRSEKFEELASKLFPEFNMIDANLHIGCQEYRRADNKASSFRSAVYVLYDLPEPKGVPTDDETKQCSICAQYIKDYALPCGHIYCIECIGKMKCECPTCKKPFFKNKCIKLFFN